MMGQWRHPIMTKTEKLETRSLLLKGTLIKTQARLVKILVCLNSFMHSY